MRKDTLNIVIVKDVSSECTVELLNALISFSLVSSTSLGVALGIGHLKF